MKKIIPLFLAFSLLVSGSVSAQAPVECHFFVIINRDVCISGEAVTSTETPTATNTALPAITQTPPPTSTSVPTLPASTGIGSIALTYKQGGSWITPAEIMTLPTDNNSWDSLVGWADKPMDIVGDIVCTAGGACGGDAVTPNAMYARAIVGIRTNDVAMLDELKVELDRVDEAVNGARGSTDTKWVQRNIALIAVSANLIDYRPADLLNALHKAVYEYTFSGETVKQIALRELNNRAAWGRWSLMATAYLLEDFDTINTIVQGHCKAMGEKNWNGVPNTYKFTLSSLGASDNWQTLQPGGKSDPIAIMPKGIYYLDHGVGGLWLADQYRSGYGPRWGISYTNYIYEGMSSYIAVAFSADHLGYQNVFALGDYALLRTVIFQASAFDGKTAWLPTGNDTWISAAIMTFAPSVLPVEYKPEPSAVVAYPLAVSAGGEPGRGIGFMYATHYARPK